MRKIGFFAIAFALILSGLFAYATFVASWGANTKHLFMGDSQMGGCVPGRPDAMSGDDQVTWMTSPDSAYAPIASWPFEFMEKCGQQNFLVLNRGGACHLDINGQLRIQNLLPSVNQYDPDVVWYWAGINNRFGSDGSSYTWLDEVDSCLYWHKYIIDYLVDLGAEVHIIPILGCDHLFSTFTNGKRDSLATARDWVNSWFDGDTTTFAFGGACPGESDGVYYHSWIMDSLCHEATADTLGFGTTAYRYLKTPYTSDFLHLSPEGKEKLADLLWQHATNEFNTEYTNRTHRVNWYAGTNYLNDGSTGREFKTVQGAIGHAFPGDTIIVETKDELYLYNTVLDRSIRQAYHIFPHYSDYITIRFDGVSGAGVLSGQYGSQASGYPELFTTEHRAAGSHLKLRLENWRVKYDWDNFLDLQDYADVVLYNCVIDSGFNNNDFVYQRDADTALVTLESCEIKCRLFDGVGSVAGSYHGITALNSTFKDSGNVNMVGRLEHIISPVGAGFIEVDGCIVQSTSPFLSTMPASGDTLDYVKVTNSTIALQDSCDLNIYPLTGKIDLVEISGNTITVDSSNAINMDGAFPLALFYNNTITARDTLNNRIMFVDDAVTFWYNLITSQYGIRESNAAQGLVTFSSGCDGSTICNNQIAIYGGGGYTFRHAASPSSEGTVLYANILYVQDSTDVAFVNYSARTVAELNGLTGLDYNYFTPTVYSATGDTNSYGGYPTGSPVTLTRPWAWIGPTPCTTIPIIPGTFRTLEVADSVLLNFPGWVNGDVVILLYDHSNPLQAEHELARYRLFSNNLFPVLSTARAESAIRQ